MKIVNDIYHISIHTFAEKTRGGKMQTRKLDETHWKYRSHIIAESDYSVKKTFGYNGYEWTEPRPVYTVEGEYANIGPNAGITSLRMAKQTID